MAQGGDRMKGVDLDILELQQTMNHSHEVFSRNLEPQSWQGKSTPRIGTDSAQG